MDGQKKQKVLIGVLAALILGAGSIWYLNRDTSGSNQQSVKTGQTTRRVREKTTDNVKTTRRIREKKDSTRRVVERRQRDESDRKALKRRHKKRTGGKKVKKEKIVPAA